MSSIGEVNQYGNILFKRAKNVVDESLQEIAKVTNYVLQYGEPFYLRDLDLLIVGDGRNTIRDLLNTHEYFAKVKDCGLFGDEVTLTYNNINNISLDTDVIANTKFVKKALVEYFAKLKQDVIVYEPDQYYTGEYPSAPVGKTAGTLEDIKKWQAFLNWYDKYELIVDGDFGNKTEEATKDFQTKNDLEVDGYAGLLTLAKAKTVTKSHGLIPVEQQIIKAIHVNEEGKITVDSEDLVIEGIPLPATELPLMDGTAAVGVAKKWAREDHVHPSDTTKANVVAPTLEAKVHSQKVTFTYGDVNEDGDIDATDLLVLRYYLEGVPEYQNINKFAADVNNDGVIDQTDYDLLRDYVTGSRPEGTLIGTVGEKTVETYEYPKLNRAIALTDSSSNFATTAFVTGVISNELTKLTVPEQPINANQTLSKISETNGKIALELQDINISMAQVSGLEEAMPKPSDALPLEDGEAKSGVGTKYSREDHTHPHDSAKADVVAPVLKTGVANETTVYPRLETGLDILDNGLNIANSEFVHTLVDPVIATLEVMGPEFETVKTDLETAKTTITEHTEKITEFETKITEHTTTLEEHTTKIEENTTKVETHETKIAELETKVDSNVTKSQNTSDVIYVTGVACSGSGDTTSKLYYCGNNAGAGSPAYNTTGVRINCYSGALYGAAWNDFAEFRKCNAEPGTVVCETGNGDLAVSHKKLQPGAAVISDTYGMVIGNEEEGYSPIAVAGRVLAKIGEPVNNYQVGMPVCAGPGGKIYSMTREEIKEYPEAIVGYVSEFPTYESWNGITVNSRIWIKIK